MLNFPSIILFIHRSLMQPTKTKKKRDKRKLEVIKVPEMLKLRYKKPHLLKRKQASASPQTNLEIKSDFSNKVNDGFEIICLCYGVKAMACRVTHQKQR